MLITHKSPEVSLMLCLCYRFFQFYTIISVCIFHSNSTDILYHIYCIECATLYLVFEYYYLFIWFESPSFTRYFLHIFFHRIYAFYFFIHLYVCFACCSICWIHNMLPSYEYITQILITSIWWFLLTPTLLLFNVLHSHSHSFA